MSPGLDISLPLFEGPLDLLLALVRKSEVEITNIPIAEITRQYLDYLHRAEQQDLDLGSEFMYMAATLIQLKSRCLLPSDPEIARREPDPRRELVRQLLDHEQVRQGAEFLQQKLEVNSAVWSRPSIDEFVERGNEDSPENRGSMNLVEVLLLARRALDTARTYQIVAPAESVTVAEMMRWLEGRLSSEPESVIAAPLFAEVTRRDRKAALFLAMLEMSKGAQIRLDQAFPFGPILMSRLTGMAQPCRNVD
jgi:segregation and condensation protein A